MIFMTTGPRANTWVNLAMYRSLYVVYGTTYTVWGLHIGSSTVPVSLTDGYSTEEEAQEAMRRMVAGLSPQPA